MRHLVPPTKSLCVGFTTAFVISGSAAFAVDQSCGDVENAISNVEFVVATVPDATIAKMRANEIALGVLMTWFEDGS